MVFFFSFLNPKSCPLCVHPHSNLCGFMINVIRWYFTHTWTVSFSYYVIYSA